MVSYIKSHDFPYQDTSLYMTPGPGYLTVVHGSPGQDTSLYMAPRARIPHCTWLPRPGYLTVHGSPDQDTSLYTWLPGPGLHDSPNVSGIPHCVWLPGPGYLTMQYAWLAPGQGTLLYMTPRARIPHCAGLIDSPLVLFSAWHWLVTCMPTGGGLPIELHWKLLPFCITYDWKNEYVINVMDRLSFSNTKSFMILRNLYK